MGRENKMLTRSTSATNRVVGMSQTLLVPDTVDKKVILEYLVEKDVPAWFRGTSTFQMEAADRLLNAIRDDIEQRTAHRVRAVLLQIGLTPQPATQDLKLLMRLSRGNDLAFLYFLMEMIYKTSSIQYSVNEQLIMSSIMHLDMVTTLRELDRLLPPPSMSKKVWEQRQREKLKGESKPPPPKKDKSRYLSPYFQKLVRPKSFGKPLSATMPDFEVNLGFYAIYKDPNYVVPNESSRWYANYDLNPGERIARNIIKEEISAIFNNIDEARSQAGSSGTTGAHRKVINDLEQSLEDKLKVIAKERCLQYFDLDKKSREEREERIKTTLEKDVCRYMCKFRRMAEKTKDQIDVMTVSGENDWEFRLVDKCPKEGHKTKDQIEVMTFSSYCDCRQHLVKESDLIDKGLVQPNPRPSIYVSGKSRRESNVSIGSISYSRTKNEKTLKEKDKENKKPSSVGLIGKSLVDMENVDSKSSKVRVSILENLARIEESTFLQHHESVKDAPGPSDMFFEAPHEHKPYQFNYHEIFSLPDKHSKNTAVKRSVVEALDDEADRPPSYISDSKINVGDAVDKCIYKIFKNGMTELEEKNKKQINTHPTDTVSYDMEYYDPDDKELMTRLLIDALEIMKQNPKFILATFPNVHKLPLIREWIYQRYGKKYTKKERYESFREAIDIFHSMEKVPMRVALPNINELGTKIYLDYKCRDYVLKKAERIKKAYYDRLDRTIMDRSRVFWFAMRPYLCSNGPPRNTFYAYMPARSMDILHFAIWSPNEYMDAKRAWEKRMFQKSD